MKTQTRNQIIVSFDTSAFVAAPIGMCAANCPVIRTAVLTGNFPSVSH
jgi:hypothetical protein